MCDSGGLQNPSGEETIDIGEFLSPGVNSNLHQLLSIRILILEQFVRGQ
jgi:hypothetical protein